LILNILDRHPRLFKVAGSVRELLYYIKYIPLSTKSIGLCKSLNHIIKAFLFRDRKATTELILAFCNAKYLREGVVLFRGKTFYVPPNLLDDFVSVLFELCTNTYRFQSSYDAVIDIGGFLGESAWWFLTEGLAKRVIVYEPVYYEVCQRNLSSIAEVYPYAIYKEKTTIEMAIQGKVSTALNDRNENL